ncbi:bifunctional UDP-N-acetylglucosamine diphosphorylase/glucosamine-1-phosphate N-acetyltransferase GlmU [Rhodomicrobium vannielii ATCC 17100]|uniref:bifunctional UDP-N-acetylglucosamine diphosphorylase/glucosamine-1-phosphate N-acetyltransferase GlmU n=1 Tax=Rhodomicrobium vannielii TaxID=1069 RepID=UPI00191977F7|nr:bifunctional UDP-N-acetylglucosamine diphosphorylase/glucosamine-1-phosphate N-acetyltransferase GlmU [Rhodomicrobium vannielii]MBJ7533037.1 bifunctional UDP-N-acetylglucosamine diphosphorylase/glucosamine-1-phosphate N-acetyltransferase GlmU [Rhodomicrobium vannielii ATCC 17100]
MAGFNAVVLAAGQGTRMKSALPKVLHPVGGLPLVAHVIKAATDAGAEACSVIVPPDAKGFDALRLPIAARFFEQHERLGTAHAVLQARPALETSSLPVVVLCGDTPLVTPDSLARLAAAIANGADMAVMGFNARNPKGYGRLITDASGALVAIREDKDASEAERAITLCNSGILAFRGDLILSLLDRIGNDNAQREYYLTDAVEVARARRLRVSCEIIDEDEVRGVNTRAQLAEAEAIFQRRAREAAMAGGATLIAPDTVTFAHDTIIGQDVVIEPNVIFAAGVVIEDGVTIRGFSHLEGARVGRGSTIGPFARFRPGTVLEAGVHVGNFVELKASHVGEGAKVNHLSYIGDANVGAKTNIGAGTITCNYDGYSKFKTNIGAGAFIGSNSSLVAPVTIGDGAYIGSGSIISEDVPPHALALTRAPQVHKDEWAKRKRARAEAEKRSK